MDWKSASTRETVDAPSLEIYKAGLDGSLGNLT